MNLCVVSTYNGTKEDYLKLYESFKDDIAKYTDGFEMGFVREISDQVIMMDEGMIVEIGSPKEIFENPQTQRAKDFFGKILRH